MIFKDYPVATCLYIFLASGLYFALFFSTTWVVPVVPRLLSNETYIHASKEQVSWIVAAPDLVLLVTCLPFVFLVDLLGRKVFLFLALAPFFALWTTVLFATTADHLLAAVVVGGLNGPLSNWVVTLYLIETSPDKVRGTVTSFRHIISSLGALVTLIIGPHLTIRQLAAVGLAFPAALLVAFIWVPETPYYLLLRGRREDAEKNLRRLRGRDDVSDELEVMTRYVEQRRTARKVNICDMFREKYMRRCVCISLIMLIARNLSGRGVFDAYSTLIFRMANSQLLNADNSSIITAAVGLATSVVIMFLVDVFGRRPLLLASCAGCAAALVAEGAYFAAPSPRLDWLPLAASMLFQVSYGVGLDSLPMMMVGEVFPAEFKAQALGLVVVVYSFLVFVQGKLFPLAVDTIGLHFLLWIFAAIMIASFPLIYFFVPETKSKSFDQIRSEILNTIKDR